MEILSYDSKKFQNFTYNNKMTNLLLNSITTYYDVKFYFMLNMEFYEHVK